MSFWELFVVGVIALIVLGPERLPKAARTVGLWVGKAKQGFNSIKTEIDRELKVKEIQQQLEEQKQNLEAQINDNVLEDVKSEMNQITNELNKPLTDSSDKQHSLPQTSENSK